jgi:hypothetical protein
LTVKGSGVFNNSRNQCGTFVAGAGSVYTIENPHQFQFAAGDYCIGAGIPPGTLNPVVEVPQIPYPPEFNILEPAITCSGSGSSAVDPNTGALVFQPGNFPNGANVSYAGGVLFQPGNYCFGKSFTLKGATQAIANNVKIRMDDGEFSLDGISSLTCSNLLVHVDGGSGIKFAGNSTIECNDVTFFATTGSVTWEGNAVMRLFAPQGGDYKNLLIYLPYPNGQNGEEVKFAGTSDSELHGSIIAVRANIKFAGVTGTEGFQSQIIGYTVELFGSTNTLIDYDPDENWAPPDPSAVTLTK